MSDTEPIFDDGNIKISGQKGGDIIIECKCGTTRTLSPQEIKMLSGISDIARE